MSLRFCSFVFCCFESQDHAILTTTNITYRPGPRFALRKVSLALEGSGITSLIGPNGAGKTTLIRVLAGLIDPDEGSVQLDARDLATFAGAERARRIGYVPQIWRPAFSFTVEQTILLGRSPWRGTYGGFESEEDLRAAGEAIELMELKKLRDVPVTELSGGELQRVMVAMALAQQADYLLLDEPTTHLDVTYQQGLLSTLRTLLTVRPVTILCSLHDLNLASIYSDRIIAMRDGAIIADGSPADVLTRETLRKTFGTELSVLPGGYRRGPAISFIDDLPGGTDV